MHRALLVEDIFKSLVEQMTPEPKIFWHIYNESARQDLLAIALVSKAFSTFALDALWAYLDSLWPLIKLLPNDSYEAPSGANIVSRALLSKVFCRSGFS
jgi:hypothetical protein